MSESILSCDQPDCTVDEHAHLLLAVGSAVARGLIRNDPLASVVVSRGPALGLLGTTGLLLIAAAREYPEWAEGLLELARRVRPVYDGAPSFESAVGDIPHMIPLPVMASAPDETEASR